jgi:plastocyanin
MRFVRQWCVSGVAVALATGSSVPGATAAGPTTYQIGVDNAAPAGHDWLYVDFFPRTEVKVHRGDVLDLKWNTGSIDALHTATLVPPDATPPPLFVPDGDDSASQAQINPVAFAPTDPTCGSASKPCVYDGTSVLNSGAQFTAPGFDFFVALNVSANTDPVTVTYVCLVHPGMQGSVTVVPDSQAASTQSAVQAVAARQHETETLGARQAEEQAEHRVVTGNSDGSHNVTVTAGTAAPFVEVAEMLPRRLHVRPGDTVTWVTRTAKDAHTVTFPQGSGSDAVDPLQTVCEAPGPIDTRPPCGASGAVELHDNPQPQGATSIASPTTVGSSGVLSNPPAPFPSAYIFSFPNAGTFAYQCRIHDHMTGFIDVVGKGPDSHGDQ